MSEPKAERGVGALPSTMRAISSFIVVALVGGFALACSASAPLPPRAVVLNRDGASALASGDLSTAEARLALAIEYSPRFVEAWVNLGLVELKRGNLDLAKKHLEKARELNPDLPAPHHALGLLADERDLGDLSEKHYRMAIKVDPGFTPARANLARRLFARRAFDDAREQFLRITELEPENAAGWTGLVESLVRLGREPEADEALARARTQVGDTPAIALLVARQLIRRAAYAEAEQVLAPLTSDPDVTRRGAAWGWIAMARIARRDCGGGARAAQEALLVDRADPLGRYAAAQAKSCAQ